MNILKEDYTHVITHNPLPIPKEERGREGGLGKQGENRDGGPKSDFSASSILVVLEITSNSVIQNLCSSKPAGSLAHPSSVVLLRTHIPELSG